MVQPLFDRVFVKRLDDSAYDEAGQIIKLELSNKIEELHRGEVVSAGDECKEVKPGDFVLYKGVAGKEIEVEKEKVIMIRESELWSVIEGNPHKVQNIL